MLNRAKPWVAAISEASAAVDAARDLSSAMRPTRQTTWLSAKRDVQAVVEKSVAAGVRTIREQQGAHQVQSDEGVGGEKAAAPVQ